MYGFDSAFIRQHEEQIRRVYSVPVMRPNHPRLQEKGRAMSMDRVFHQVDDRKAFDAEFGKGLGASSGFKKPEPSPADEQLNKGSTLTPILLTIIMGQGALLFGYHIGFSSPTAFAIQKQLGIDKITTDLIFSLISIGAIVGCLTAAPLADLLGRKRAAMFACLPFTIGSLLMVFFPNVACLCVGRTVIGVGVGEVSVLVPLYIAEISPAHLRGSLGTANQFLIGFGIVIVNAVGLPILNSLHWWKSMLYISLVPVAVLFFGMLFIGVETPRWLVGKQKEDDAEKALRFIRGIDYNVTAELNDIIQMANKNGPNDEEGAGLGETSSLLKKDKKKGGNDTSSRLKFLFTKGLRPFLIGIALQLLQQWTGINAIMFHTSDLFKQPGDEGLTPKALYGAIGVNVVQVLMCGVTVVCMNLAGRRTFLISSHFGMSIVGIVMGLAYYYKWDSVVQIALVCVYLAFFSIGVGPLPWLLCSEIFPSKSREQAMAIATFVNWASAFGVTSTVSAFEKMIHIYGVFWFYSAVGFIGIIFVYLVLPETKDKTLEEIEGFFIEDE